MFPHKLKSIRKAKKLTQQEVADRLGISRQAYGYYEKGTRQPDIDSLNQIADIFDVSIDDLLNRSAPSEANIDLKEILNQSQKAHFGGIELNDEDKAFLYELFELAIQRKKKKEAAQE
ncbi:DNA-binding transcriptional regulator, XRE-family HTH domain [Marininema mesophilum]|uniref:DNA-binding transcriptional regulator, XRE-family HTH domain n=1 Tax=Marininema mesophilum TaxID=1048340 RepID=A0A1H3BVW0_9BACL|nr:helix-turn-helix transcriptional regulator [Marininema mesophilum]SDX46077.1 DNA-binding transcriptional regulator, XRE-family HTH domain [Marininema mesophilum]